MRKSLAVQQKDAALLASYPVVLSKNSRIGNIKGWYPIVERLLQTFTDLLHNHYTPGEAWLFWVQALQERHGALDVKVTWHTREIDEHIKLAVNQSRRVCNNCGKAKPFNGNCC